MRLREGATSGSLVLESTDSVPPFGAITLDEPTNSLSIRSGAGDDSLSVDPELIEPSLALQFDGGAGTDSLVLEPAAKIGGLNDGATYSVIPDAIDSKKLQLSSSLPNAVDLTSLGTGALHTLSTGPAKSFLVSGLNGVDSAGDTLYEDDTLIFATAHGFSTGQAVLYSTVGLTALWACPAGGFTMPSRSAA